MPSVTPKKRRPNRSLQPLISEALGGCRGLFVLMGMTMWGGEKPWNGLQSIDK